MRNPSLIGKSDFEYDFAKKGVIFMVLGFFRFGGFSRGKKVEISGFRRQKSGFFGSKTGFSGFGAKKLMGTRVLAKTRFSRLEIDSRFSYFSTFSKSQLRFGARSLLHSRTCVYALIKSKSLFQRRFEVLLNRTY